MRPMRKQAPLDPDTWLSKRLSEVHRSSCAPASTAAAGAAAGRIFVSIAAYCDPELPATLRSMLLHAERWLDLPEILPSFTDASPVARLHGVAQVGALATGEGSDPPLPPGGELPLPGRRAAPRWRARLGGRLREVRLRAEDARGPCWARYLAQLLWRGEELYLQLDSHMRFVPQWDRHMREQLAACLRRSAKPVLCGYGRGYELGTPYDWTPPADDMPCLNCAGFFDDNSVLNIRYRTLKAQWPAPQPALFWSAHFSFSSSELLAQVPYDPQLPMLFYGEEILMTVRMFTHGWDLFAPSRGLVYHLWQREYRRVYIST
ncbi:unnamed protein product [Prorocentrum cordatum]|uniref:Uncharacterized protein n=1 Tax=Prorocentrum cordatum TaxID=2364126 RepID=A0ABN9UYZ0_9DINO|nr:unnamed protein product [Polarella glacialis]